MSEVASRSQSLGRTWLAGGPRAWIPERSTAAALRAVRAAVVVSGLFAITLEGIGNLQMATFAAFGGFASLVLSSFGGTRRDLLIAHTLLAVVGSALLAIGTVVSSSTALAALVTVPVTFAVFYAGIAGPNAASGATGAMLAYVLPAASPGTVAMIPDRLAGWWLASVASTVAVLAFSSRSEDDALRGSVSRLARSLAEEIEANLAGRADEERLDTCIEAKHSLLALFSATPYRPVGLAAADQALANVVELLEWCTSLVVDAVREHGDLRAAATADRELLGAAAALLRDVGTLFADGSTHPELARLERCRERSLTAAAELQPAHEGFRDAAQIAFHAQAIAVAALAIGGEALLAERIVAPRPATDSPHPQPVSEERPRASVARVAVRNASLRSVWFINSLRSSLALAAAVAVADLSSVQHGFWVVLGTLSVLRTNAAATGATAVRALSGTAVGFVVGGALLLVIGSEPTALWLVLPAAVFVAAYTPGTAPFAVGQAAFTVTVAVLFNLLVPVGWKVGLLRIEDVALGCTVSVLVGSMFWPRGVSSVVGDDLADVFRAGAAHLAQAVQWTCGLRAAAPDAAPAARTAALRLDDALRGYLAEQGSKRIDRQQLWRLVGGSLRLRLTAQAVARLPRDPGALSGAGGAIERRTAALTAWYERLAELLGAPRRRATPALAPPALGPEDVVQASAASHYVVWLCEHLDHLAEHLGELVVPALRVAELRRRPWWR